MRYRVINHDGRNTSPNFVIKIWFPILNTRSLFDSLTCYKTNNDAFIHPQSTLNFIHRSVDNITLTVERNWRLNINISVKWVRLHRLLESSGWKLHRVIQDLYGLTIILLLSYIWQTKKKGCVLMTAVFVPLLVWEFFQISRTFSPCGNQYEKNGNLSNKTTIML